MKILLAMLLLLGTAMPAVGADLLSDQQLKAIVEADWHAIEKTSPPFDPANPRSVSWTYRVSPPFPVAWPPTANKAIAFYAYAEGFSFNIRDGQYIAAPWGKIEVVGKEKPRKTILRNDIRNLGVQGVHPQTAEESQLSKDAASAPAYLAALDRQPDDSDLKTQQIRNYYCLWLKGNGVVADYIKKYHASFFTWLACS